MKVSAYLILVVCLIVSVLNMSGQAPSASTANLPSEATVEAFLKRMFGWNQNLAWKVASIKPSEAPGISEVTVVFNTSEGQTVQRIYITPDEHYAFSGDLVPFGA